MYVCRYKKRICTIYVVSRMDIYNIYVHIYVCMYSMYVCKAFAKSRRINLNTYIQRFHKFSHN